MGDTRAEGERNFWNGTESVTAKGGPFKAKPTPVNTKVLYGQRTLVQNCIVSPRVNEAGIFFSSFFLR